MSDAQPSSVENEQHLDDSGSDPAERSNRSVPQESPRSAGQSPAARHARSARNLTRNDVYSRPVVGGREQNDNLARRLIKRFGRLLTSAQEREEAELDAQLASRPEISRTNTVAILSPKGGVGKTTCTFLLGNLLASDLKLRCVAIDANPDFGTLGALAPDSVRVSKSLVDIVGAWGNIKSAAQLRPFVSALPTGLHLVAAPPHAEVMAEMTPKLYEGLTEFLSRFYEVVLLDLGTGITGPLARFAVERSDQTLLVTTPEFVTASTVLGALRYLRGDPTADNLTVVLNQAPLRPNAGDRQAIEEEFRRQQIEHHVTIPYDQRLRTMLDSGTYTVDGLARHTRMPIKQLALTAAHQLV